MIESEGSILSYRPDPEMLAKNFHYRHVEPLLAQADGLMEKCLKESDNYSSLDYAWTEFVTELETQERQLELDKKREGYEPEAPEEPPAEVAEETEEPPEEPAEEEPAVTGAVEDEEGAQETEERAGEPPKPEEVVPEETSHITIRMKALRRRRVLSGKGGPFALNEQRDLALRRLGVNYREALNRAIVAEEGLKRIYDREQPPLPLPEGSETLSAVMTNLSIWIRDSLKWLEAYHQLEQAFTRVVSLRSLLNRNQWTQLKHSRDSYALKLRVPEELFKSHHNCRIRSVGASLVGEAGVVPWSLSIKLPEKAIYERVAGMIEVDQSALPPCLLGRVENRRATCPSQVCDNTFLNASPVGVSTPEGAWSIEIFKPLGSGTESFDHLSDIVIEISASGIPRQARS
jgi:hypothetical protein